jgi:hypothetical protein
VRVSWFDIKTKVDGLLVVWLQNNWVGFSSLGFKTDSYGLMIWAPKSPRRFFGFGLKTKRASVCWLHHKIDGRMKTVRGTRRDLVACFTWKQVRLEFSILDLRLVEARRGWCTWHHHRGCIELKLKTDESIRQTTSDHYTPSLLFSMYSVLGVF